MTDFYLYGRDIILRLTIFHQIFLLRLNAINCAYKASRCILDRLIKLFAQWYNERLKRVLFQCFVVTATTDTCVSYKASIEAQNVRES